MSSEWLRPAQASEYASISLRTLYIWFEQGLTFSKVGQCRLIKKENLDNFIAGFEVETDFQRTDKIVDDVLAELVNI